MNSEQRRAVSVLRTIGLEESANILEGYHAQREPAETGMSMLGEYLLNKFPGFAFDGSAADFAIQAFEALHITPSEIGMAVAHQRDLMRRAEPADHKLTEAEEFGMWLTTRPRMVCVGGDVAVYAMTDALREWADVKQKREQHGIAETLRERELLKRDEFLKGEQWTREQMEKAKQQHINKQMSDFDSATADEGPKVAMGQAEHIERYGLPLHLLQRAVDSRSEFIDPVGQLSVLFFTTELGGEIGEALNVVKKLERERLGIPGRRDDVAHLAKELGDSIVTICNVARFYNIDLTAATIGVFNTVSAERGLPVRLM